MLSHQDQLTELVRLLEEDRHVFASDPLLITEKMKDEMMRGKTLTQKPIEQLRQRAARIDSSGALGTTLTKIDARVRAIIWMMSALWCVTGFIGLFALLQSEVVNFFYVLVCLLGVHTLMLGAWLVMTLRQNAAKSSFFGSLISPQRLIRGRDDVTQAAVRLYERQLNHSGMRWYVSKFSHQLWLASLTGMLLAIIFLLIVRQYSFSWESTLLSDHALVQLTAWLGFLPSLVGFDVPSTDAIIQSRRVTDAMPISLARQWASLLIGSLLMYGLLPRAIAWAFCAFMFARRKMRIDISLPYYQKILSFWHKQVVDDDDFQETAAPTAKPADIHQGQKLVATLEYPADDNWWHLKDSALDPQIHDFGVIDDREDVTRLIDYLTHHPVQVVLGVSPNTLPDRGVLRRIDRIAEHAKFGVVVQLLDDHHLINQHSQNTRLQQWQTALSARKIGIIA